MKKLTVCTTLALCCLLLPLSLAGQQQALTPASANSCGLQTTDGSMTPDRSTLFFSLPDSHHGALTVEVRALVDGEVALTESAGILPADEGTNEVIELFAFNPQARERLFQIATERPVQIELRFDGGQAISVSFSDLVRGSAELRETAVRPRELRAVDLHQTRSPLFADEPSLSNRILCSQCWTNYYNCQYSNCDPQFPPQICNMCDNMLNNCLANCEDDPPPPCEDYYEDTTTTVLLSINYIYLYECYEDPFSIFGDEWEYFHYTRRNFKRTVTRTWYYCDGTTSTQVISVTYPYDYCHLMLFQSCYNGYPYSPFCWYW